MFLLTPIPQALLEIQLLKRKAAGTPAAALAHPTGMLPLLRLRGLPPPGWAWMKLKGLLRIYRVKEARRYHRNPIAATSTKESLVPPAVPLLHPAQSTHLQLTFFLYLCSSTCSSAAIPTASPFQGWLWCSSFQRLPALLLWLPSKWSPALGKEDGSCPMHPAPLPNTVLG